jgi:hypothetical protein
MRHGAAAPDVVTLFDDMTRTDTGYAAYAEPQYTYVNRSARDDVGRVRALLESWFARYPAEGRASLQADFRSTDDWQHAAAFFELFLHELLVRLGCVVTLHPAVPGTSRRPDFLAVPKRGLAFYLEATLATGESLGERSARRRANVVYDALNQLESPDFFLWLEVPQAPATPPSGRALRRRVAAWLATLKYDDVRRIYESKGTRSLPTYDHEQDGWTIRFRARPKYKVRGHGGIRPIGSMTSGRVHEVDTRTPLRDALVDKAGRYGELDRPYVIAVNATSPWTPDRISVMEALFGRESFRFGRSGVIEMRRIPDGAWTAPTGPRYTRTSAALIVPGVNPWNVASCELCLYHNPWAQRPYSSPLRKLTHAVVGRNGTVRWRRGVKLAGLFDLPPGWPR